jgi:putative ABC transport system ATP-binding protein
VLQLCKATKEYSKTGRTIRAVDELDLELTPGELAVVHGPSGSGKSTLLLMLGGMLPPDQGKVLYDGRDIYNGSASPNRYRRQAVGFVFQRFCLIPYLTLYDNIRIPLALANYNGPTEQVIGELARMLRIEDRLGHRPSELSIGEQQRAALARAIVGDKKIILADEPTGNLDVANIKIVTDCLVQLSQQGRIVVMVTHNPSLLDIATRSLRIEAGKIAPQGSRPEVADAVC